MSRSAGQVKRGDVASRVAFEKAEVRKREMRMLQDLQRRVEEKIKSNPSLAQFKNQMLIDMTAEGLRIQIVDEQNRPMFDSGAADLKPYTRDILREIAALLNEVPNRISLAGHTDAKPFSSGERGYSNWELSSDRANACRRELIGGGIKEEKIIRVVGLASATPFDREDLYNPINRRISITVLNQETEENIMREAGKAIDAQQLIDANVAAGNESEPTR